MKYLAALVLLAISAVHCSPQREARAVSDDAEVSDPQATPECPNLPDGDDDDGDDSGDRKKRWTWNPAPPDDSYNSVPSGDFSKSGGTGKAGGCSSKYRALENSTMCAFRDSNKCTQFGMSSQDKNTIVSYHNTLRGKENAKDMLKMYWDNKAQPIAQKLAQSCIYAHDTSANRMIPEYGHGQGQNLCRGTANVKRCMDLWYDEKRYFTYGGRNVLSRMGHFSQMVSARTVSIACGHAYCNNGVGHYWVCNYGYEQNTGDINMPYVRGSKCGMCPSKCRGNMCNCGMKICKNGGTLDVSNCSCKCRAPFSGSTCGSVNCNNTSNQCGRGLYVKKNCSKYRDLPEKCPKICLKQC